MSARLPFFPYHFTGTVLTGSNSALALILLPTKSFLRGQKKPYGACQLQWCAPTFIWLQNPMTCAT